MRLTKESVLFSLLIALTVVTFTSSSFGVRSSYLIFLDWKCNINFNYTLLLEDAEQSVSREKYISCYNNTIARMDRNNVTMNERFDCFLKCSQIANAELDEVGEKFNSNITNLIKDNYEKYSDADPVYIKKIAHLMQKCAIQANQEYKQSVKNGTKSGECAINGHYDNCWWESLDEYNISDKRKISKLCLRSQ